MKCNPPVCFYARLCPGTFCRYGRYEKKGNEQLFKMPRCTLGNVASAHWSCWCFVRNLRCSLPSHTAVFEVSQVVLWLFCLFRFVFWLLIDLPDDCMCLLLFLFVLLTDTATTSPFLNPPTPTNTNTDPLNVTLSPVPHFCSTEALTVTTLLLFSSMNASVCRIAGLFGGLRFTWLVCLLRASFTMLLFELWENLHNLRGLMKNNKLLWQIIWLFWWLEISEKWLPLWTKRI